MTVTIELADLCEVFGTAKLYDHMQRKAEAAEKEADAAKKEANAAKAENVAVLERLSQWEKSSNEGCEAERKAHTFLAVHDTPFESQEVDEACHVIRALIVRAAEQERPRELQPVTKTAIKNANDVLDHLFRPSKSDEDEAKEAVPGDHFHTVYNALRDLVSRLEQEGLK